ncbi:MAG: hypothetical protein B1H09_03005 [Gemmatimonadaceae bacterium 4484_173]|nr:MAG: hypothetical protein B1H09_03005 [Gemmatimonadaceae bacterium 4484_173]RKZ04218.1 MAG: hypothetical protein DRQ21_03415 [Candidatus Fermentibacteria bacterium]
MCFFPIVLAGLTGVIPMDTPLATVSQMETVIGEDGAVILWPVVEGDLPGTSRINEILNYENAVGETLEETSENYSINHRGIVGSSFRVVWSDPQFLDLEITVETLGAYPSSMVFRYLFDLETGEEVTPNDLFLPETMPELIQLCDSMLQDRIHNETGGGYVFTEEDLENVGMRRGGIVFHYDFNYPHAAAAAEPDGELFFPWSEINRFLLPRYRR